MASSIAAEIRNCAEYASFDLLREVILTLCGIGDPQNHEACWQADRVREAILTHLDPRTNRAERDAIERALERLVWRGQRALVTGHLPEEDIVRTMDQLCELLPTREDGKVFSLALNL